MPNMKNAEKKVKVIAKKKELNNSFKAGMRTAIKNVEKAVKKTEKDTAKDNLNIAIKKIDKVASKGLVHKNYVARQKSRLTKKINQM